MALHNITGRIGEDLAAEYLKSKKYKILERNVRERWGELDLLARAPDGCLVFIEVKTMSGLGSRPEEHYTLDKNRKTMRFTDSYIVKHPEMFSDAAGYRIDLLAVELPESLTAQPVIRHYEGVA